MYPHTGVWDCTRHGPRRRQQLGFKRRRLNGDVDPFYENFRLLPNEMKLKCMAYAPFHVIANQALWMDDTDPWFTEQIMRDKHVTESACWMCDNMQLTFLCPSPRPVTVGLRQGGAFVFRPLETTTACLGTTERLQKIDWRFGDVNRYPCFYYRSCAHYDQPVTKRQNTSEAAVLERWRRLHGPEAMDDEILRRVGESARLRIAYDAYRSKRTKSPDTYPLADPVTLDLRPGMYYWELVNYNWEEKMALIEGAENRQRHFFIDPADPSHDVTARHQIDMSLLLRKVCHPSEETTDRFETVGYFERMEVKTTGHHLKPCVVQPHSNQNTVVYFKFGDEEDDTHTPATQQDGGKVRFLKSPQAMYMHSLTPTHGVRVYKCQDAGLRKQIPYFFALLPANMTPHSLQRNKNTVRLNIFTKTLDEDVAGASLVTAVTSPVERGYCFIPSKQPVFANTIAPSVKCGRLLLQ